MAKASTKKGKRIEVHVVAPKDSIIGALIRSALKDERDRVKVVSCPSQAKVTIFDDPLEMKEKHPKGHPKGIQLLVLEDKAAEKLAKDRKDIEPRPLSLILQRIHKDPHSLLKLEDFAAAA